MTSRHDRVKYDHSHYMTLSSREVSLSEHVKRRRSPPFGGGRPPLHHYHDVEGGFETHAASYGNYDSNSCRSYPATEHGCYAAEDSIVAPRSGRLTPPTRSASSVRFHLSSPSSDMDMLDGRSHRLPMSGSSDCPSRRTSHGNTSAHTDPSKRPSQYMHTNREDVGSTMHPYYPRSHYESSSYSQCPSVASASTASTTGISSSSSGHSNSSSINEPVILEDNDIHQGIYDISSLVATYLAGALAFVIGIFLLVLSPFLKAIRLVVSDIRGLLGDLGILHEFGNVLRLWRELRRRSRRRNDNYGRYDDDDLHVRDVVNRYHDDESTVHTDSSTIHTEHSPQFVGGWTPSCPSVGSYGSSAATNDRSFRQSTPENSMRSSSWRREDRSQSIRSHSSSLPLYNRGEEYYPGRHQSRPSRDVSSLR